MSGEIIDPLVRLVLALPVVLGLAYLALKYGLARRFAITSGNRRMKLVEQLPLGPKAVLSLVSLGGRYYLLAHQDNSVTLIKELGTLPEPDEVKTGDSMELTPKTLEEFGRVQGLETFSGAVSLPEVVKEKFRKVLLGLAGLASGAKGAFTSRLAARNRSGEKGDRNFEG